MSSKSSKERTAARASTGIPVRSSGHPASAVRALQFPTPVSGSEVASPKVTQRENVDVNDLSSSSTDDDDAVLHNCIKMAWVKKEDEDKPVSWMPTAPCTGNTSLCNLGSCCSTVVESTLCNNEVVGLI